MSNQQKRGCGWTHATPLCDEAENKSQVPYYYTTGADSGVPACVVSFEFYRFRFQFQALEPVRFSDDASANAVRGACGALLRQSAPREVYQRIFEPGGSSASGPSGLADWPRPFVFRTAHLDGAIVQPGEPFFFDVHVFDLEQPMLPYFQSAFAQLAAEGIGPRRGRARLVDVEALDVSGQPASLPCSLPLDPEPVSIDAVTVRFATPTELKSGGQLTDRPEFAALFGRLRDRLGTLRALYGRGPLEVDFPGLGARAAQITLGRCDLRWKSAARTSSRTGQTHPLGGFTGEAEYQGTLAEFLPWLRAARWVGVGRQTVWGKGDVRVIREHSA